mgnify:CR=1 FL=1
MSSPNRSVLEFLGKMLAAYGLWYLLYDLWLLPDGRLDAWISESVVQVGGVALQLFGVEATVTARQLTLPGTAGIRVVDGCNGLSSMGLFVGFVLAFPGQLWRRVLFLPLGLLLVYLSNVSRVTGLLFLQKYWDAGFGAAHSIGAPLFFYTVIFGLWVLWAHFGGASSDPDAEDSDAEDSARPAIA